MSGSSHGKRIRRLKRKIRKQAKQHAESCKEKDREIQELKLTKRHHSYVFRDALRFIYSPYGEGSMYYSSWDKEEADGFCNR